MPARIFTVPEFDRFARKARIADSALVAVVERAERGLVDADLGGGLVKLRVPRPGQGRSGGYRTLVALVAEHRAVFVFGFAKNDMGNVSDEAEADFREAGRAFQRASDDAIAALVEERTLREIDREQDR